MRLVDDVVRSFQVAKVCDVNSRKISQIDFSPRGRFMLTSSEDDRIIIYDCSDGQLLKTVNSRKYGVNLIQFCSNSETSALHSSTKVNDFVRHVSLTENKYIRYFEGHTNKVVSLSVSSVANTFATGSLDQSVRLWDLRSPNCRERINVMGRPVTGFDPDGLVLAIGINSETLRLYDARAIDKGPFNIAHYPPETELCDWTDLTFSQDGHVILIPTNGSSIKLLNAFDGSPVYTFTGYENTRRIPIQADFSPDSKYIFSGSSNGQIHVWNSLTGQKVGAFNGDRSDPVHCVKFHPSYMMIASSASTITTFWLPPLVDETNLQ